MDGDRAQRSDARRNYDQLLATARVVFAEQGTDASLRDVARRAGVGLGTLYRHFPTRDALLEAVLGHGFERLAALADALAAERAPADALAAWLPELMSGASTFRGLPASLVATKHDPDSALHASCSALHAAGGRLLVAAQQAGVARPDVTSDELFALVGAVASLSEYGSPLAERRDHLLRVVLDGLAAATG